MSKRLLMLLFMVWAAIFLPLTAQENKENIADQGDAPKIQFEATEFNFGQIDQHQVLPFQFTFKNAGEGVLKIDKVQPTCGCTLVENPPTELAPGASATIKGTFNSGVYSGDVVRTITVASNDPVNPNLELHIKSNVKEKLSMEPRTITIANINDQKKKIVNNVLLHQAEKKPITITSMTNTKEYITVTYSKKAAVEQELKVEVDPGKVPKEKNNGNIQIDEIKLQVTVEGEKAPIDKVLTIYLY